MKPTCWAAAAIVAIAGATVAHASDMIGVYARVEKVVLEPSEGPAQRIQVWGVFALADQKDGNAYHAPVRGYLYYTLPANAALARREWADLQSVAGIDQLVAFGSRWSQTGARPCPRSRRAAGAAGRLHDGHRPTKDQRPQRLRTDPRDPRVQAVSP